MDQEIRNKLRNVVTRCRKLLEDSISQELEGKYGIFAKKEQVIADPNARMAHLNEEEQTARNDILDHFEHIRARGFKPKVAFDQLVREIAFTHLNRLCAYKMMEAREVYVGGQKFREAVSRGANSSGVKFYLADHPEEERLFNTGRQDVAYRHFLDWLGGLLSEEIGVLFNPNDPANRLYPRQKTLDEVLDLLNGGGIKPEEVELREQWPKIWSQDETIGWVYQYFTPKELRDQARKESQAPRNSYELAFRNQFFTPRYVVEFLTDNTLGRIWYEARQGETKLKDQCRYMVRRPTEIFLKEGELPPEDAANGRDDLSEEDLLKLPVHIPHRQKKDPRELKILDPACGSGHFLLYCFDLLLTIYEEAYADPDLGPALHKNFSKLEDLRRHVPEMILAHNLHGIDIDLRASQIAALALWLRCQRAYQEIGLKKDRPEITRSNFVCAEPMPGEEHMLKEFVGQLEPRLLGQLVEVVFDRMKLAGEAGSLLKIEEEIRDAVVEARRQWRTVPISTQRMLFAAENPIERQQRFDLSGINDAQFFEQAEVRVVDALRRYAEQAQNGQWLKRRLFAEDAGRGFAFVDLCHKRFDVMLMNPPFGASSKPAKAMIESRYPRSKYDVYAAFVEQGIDRLGQNGLLGAITSRTGFFLSSFQKWREEILLAKAPPIVFADLGHGVLDGAMVEVAAYCLQKRSNSTVGTTVFLRLHGMANISETMLSAIQEPSAAFGKQRFELNPFHLGAIPGSAFAYWVGPRVLLLFRSGRCLGDVAEAWVGLQTNDDFRWIRTWWESTPSDRTRKAVPFAKGGFFSSYYADVHLSVQWGINGEALKEWKANDLRLGMITANNSKCWNEKHYFRCGITWPSRTQAFGPRILPGGCIFGHKGPAAFARDQATSLALVALMNSDAFVALLGTRLNAADATARSYEVGIVRQTPLPYLDDDAIGALMSATRRAWYLKRLLDSTNENSHAFRLPALAFVSGNTVDERIAAWKNHLHAVELEFGAIKSRVDELCFKLYGIENTDRHAIIDGLARSRVEADDDGEIEAEDVENRSMHTSSNCANLCGGLISWAVGIVFGRFDARTGEWGNMEPSLPDPFDALPVCSPGMLQGDDGLPLAATPLGYPLRINWDGILLDDIDHSDDVSRRVRDVLELVWKSRAEAVEQEACGILGVKELRDYFRKPGKGGFWGDHVSRYSMSRRKAPIFWLLQTSKKNYALWLYYNRLDKDLLFKALFNYVEPKIRLEASLLEALRGQITVASESSKETRFLARQVERQEDFLSELRDFEDKLRRAANLHLEPDLNDGVVLNIAPLHELVPWKEAKKYWDELLEGKYEWSSIGKQLREKGLVP